MACVVFAAAASADEALEDQRQLAIQTAARKAAGSLVRIETTGGLESVGKVLRGGGPTTGIIISPDGLIISSAFNLAHRPAGVLVSLGDGRRLAAKVLGIDHSRQLALLKVDATELEPIRWRSKADIKIGQTAIALGGTLGLDPPSIAVGIVSATRRIWDRAIQTDAKTSPANYGGALVDLEGQALGVIVPLSPTAVDVSAGVEWYDSGIGFAVPFEDVGQRIDRLKKGDLYPGLVGVTFHSPNLFTSPIVINDVAWKSPADKAGLKVGDQIIEVEKSSVARLAQLKHELGSHYAGDVIELAVRRSEETIRQRIELVDKMPIFRLGLLGVIPVGRSLVVQSIVPDSPAAKLGLKAGDRIEAINDATVAEVAAASRILDDLAPSQEAAVRWQRGAESTTSKLKLMALPTKIPDTLEPSSANADAKVSLTTSKTIDPVVSFTTLTPAEVNDATALGLVVWLHHLSAPKKEALVEAWKPIVHRWQLAVVFIEPPDKTWKTEDFASIKTIIEQTIEQKNIDPRRVIVHGMGEGATAAEAFASQHRTLVHGLALVNASSLQSSSARPDQKLSYLLVLNDKIPLKPQFEAFVERLQQRGVSAYLRPTKQAVTAYLSASELELLGRWSMLLAAL